MSSADRTSSGSTSGSVFCTGIVSFSLSLRPVVPGSSSMNMSFRPVRGRSCAVASVRRSSSWLSILSRFRSIVTTATPFFGSTAVIFPTSTPATRTVWPWPGMTAWASENSALSSNGGFSMNGKYPRDSCWEMM